MEPGAADDTPPAQQRHGTGPDGTLSRIASEVVAALGGSGGGEAMARRAVFGLVEAFDRADGQDRQAMMATPPPPTGDRRFDALLAGLVEHLCVRDGIFPPSWVEGPERYLDRWWFMSGLSTLHAMALRDSPISLARRGIFVCEGALTYA